MEAFAVSWPILDLTPAVVLEAARGVSDHGLAYCNAQIRAISRPNQIGVVFSEDFNSGGLLDGVRFENSFAAEFSAQTRI